MIPKLAIEKAIEGGWMTQEAAEMYHASHKEIALDSTFWQALGKALGWGSFYDTEGMKRYHVPMLQGWYPTTTTASGYDEQAWQGVALYFYDLILTGGDTEKFWADLLTN